MNTTNPRRPVAAPAYYLGRSASVWQVALQRHRRDRDLSANATRRTPS
jgi:hypothetical protein